MILIRIGNDECILFEDILTRKIMHYLIEDPVCDNAYLITTSLLEWALMKTYLLFFAPFLFIFSPFYFIYYFCKIYFIFYFYDILFLHDFIIWTMLFSQFYITNAKRNYVNHDKANLIDDNSLPDVVCCVDIDTNFKPMQWVVIICRYAITDI